MKRLLTAVMLSGLLVPVWGSVAQADGCYICSSGSSPGCKDYCRYSGSDTFDNRKQCERRGCKIGGTASCPTAVNYKVCQGPAAKEGTLLTFACVKSK